MTDINVSPCKSEWNDGTYIIQYNNIQINLPINECVDLTIELLENIDSMIFSKYIDGEISELEYNSFEKITNQLNNFKKLLKEKEIIE